MPLIYELPGDSKPRLVGAPGRHGDDAILLLLLLADVAPSAARRMLKLSRRATGLDALAAGAGVEPAHLRPLSLLSSGIYSEDDCLSQFEEEWEIEEYGENAKKVVDKNKAAWQPPAALAAALNAALSALSDTRLAKLVLPADRWADARELLTHLRELLDQAVSIDAVTVCLELDSDC